VAVGDLLVVGVGNAGTTTAAAPTGWTKTGTYSAGTAQSVSVFWAPYAASLTLSFTNAASVAAWVCNAYTPTTGTVTLDGNPVAASNTTNNTTMPTGAPTTGALPGDYEILFYAWTSGATISGVAAGSVIDATQANGTTISVALGHNTTTGLPPATGVTAFSQTLSANNTRKTGVGVLLTAPGVAYSRTVTTTQPQAATVAAAPLIGTTYHPILTTTQSQSAGLTVVGTASHVRLVKQVRLIRAIAQTQALTLVVTPTTHVYTVLVTTTQGQATYGAFQWTYLPFLTPTTTSTDATQTNSGTAFHTDIGATLLAVRYYRPAADTGPTSKQIGVFNDSNGALLWASTTATEVPGWNTIYVVPPLALAPALTYVVAYHSQAGVTRINENDLPSSNGPLHADQGRWLDAPGFVNPTNPAAASFTGATVIIQAGTIFGGSMVGQGSITATVLQTVLTVNLSGTIVTAGSTLAQPFRVLVVPLPVLVQASSQMTPGGLLVRFITAPMVAQASVSGSLVGSTGLTATTVAQATITAIVLAVTKPVGGATSAQGQTAAILTSGVTGSVTTQAQSTATLGVSLAGATGGQATSSVSAVGFGFLLTGSTVTQAQSTGALRVAVGVVNTVGQASSSVTVLATGAVLVGAGVAQASSTAALSLALTPSVVATQAASAATVNTLLAGQTGGQATTTSSFATATSMVGASVSQATVTLTTLTVRLSTGTVVLGQAQSTGAVTVSLTGASTSSVAMYATFGSAWPLTGTVVAQAVYRVIPWFLLSGQTVAQASSTGQTGSGSLLGGTIVAQASSSAALSVVLTPLPTGGLAQSAATMFIAGAANFNGASVGVARSTASLQIAITGAMTGQGSSTESVVVATINITGSTVAQASSTATALYALFILRNPLPIYGQATSTLSAVLLAFSGASLAQSSFTVGLSVTLASIAVTSSANFRVSGVIFYMYVLGQSTAQGSTDMLTDVFVAQPIIKVESRTWTRKSASITYG
jgi:hypothetical protein